jgi:hypothetical protein
MTKPSEIKKAKFRHALTAKIGAMISMELIRRRNQLMVDREMS